MEWSECVLLQVNAVICIGHTYKIRILSRRCCYFASNSIIIYYLLFERADCRQCRNDFFFASSSPLTLRIEYSFLFPQSFSSFFYFAWLAPLRFLYCTQEIVNRIYWHATHTRYELEMRYWCVKGTLHCRIDGVVVESIYIYVAIVKYVARAIYRQCRVLFTIEISMGSTS